MRVIFVATAFALVRFGFATTTITVGPRDPVQTAHLTLHSAAAQYTLAVPADGSVVPTDVDNIINIIEVSDFFAFTNCKFGTDDPVALVDNIDLTTGATDISVGPPSTITNISCEGTCLETFENCVDENGQFVGVCCNGFCAADKCRPFND